MEENKKTNCCVDCDISTKNFCEVCKRPVCESCVKDNHKKNNFKNTEPNKQICAYCADVYWRGF